jgi:hypothetical protein
MKTGPKERAGNAACEPGGDVRPPDHAARPAGQASDSNPRDRQLSPAGCFGLLLLVLLLLYLAFDALLSWILRNISF